MSETSPQSRGPSSQTSTDGDKLPSYKFWLNPINLQSKSHWNHSRIQIFHGTDPDLSPPERCKSSDKISQIVLVLCLHSIPSALSWFKPYLFARINWFQALTKLKKSASLGFIPVMSRWSRYHWLLSPYSSCIQSISALYPIISHYIMYISCISDVQPRCWLQIAIRGVLVDCCAM